MPKAPTVAQELRMKSVLYGIDRLETCVLRSAAFPSRSKREEFRSQMETLRGHVCRLFSGQLTDAQMKRVEDLKDQRLYDILESLYLSGWLDALTQPGGEHEKEARG